MTEVLTTTKNLDQYLVENDRGPLEWSKPEEFDLRDQEAREELEHRFVIGEVQTVFDPLKDIANDLYEFNHPDAKDDEQRRSEFVSDVVRQGASFGRWFYFPWSQELVRYPEVADHRALRTSRNRDLITSEEQSRLYDSTVAVFGLSVGSKVVENLVSSGIGGKIIIGDPDTIAPSNLNRLSAGFTEVGARKIDDAAIKISKIDPYIEQVHFSDGLTQDNLHILASHDPDLVFDEVDNLSMKAAIRLFGAETETPIVMATDLGDRSMIDVERYDLGKTKPFNGRLKPEQVAMLAAGTGSPEEAQKLMMKIVGLRHITSRMLRSVMQIDKNIAGMPQLGTTATVGGAYATIAAREIILGHEMASGRYVVSPKNVLNLQPQATVLEGLRTVYQFAKSAKSES